MIKLNTVNLDQIQDALSTYIELLQAHYNQGRLSHEEKERVWLQLEELEDLYIKIIEKNKD